MKTVNLFQGHTRMESWKSEIENGTGAEQMGNWKCKRALSKWEMGNEQMNSPATLHSLFSILHSPIPTLYSLFSPLHSLFPILHSLFPCATQVFLNQQIDDPINHSNFWHINLFDSCPFH